MNTSLNEEHRSILPKTPSQDVDLVTVEALEAPSDIFQPDLEAID